MLPHLLKRLPASLSRYYEPFMGSAALYFALVRENRVRQATLSDTNQELVDTFIAVRDCVEQVMDLLRTYEYSHDFYYQMRAKDPETLPIAERAARMIYLNKTGYNGLYRVNQKGKFNVPFGRYKSPRFYDRDNLICVSEALQNTDIFWRPFDDILLYAQPGDVVYFDPPYVPVSVSSNFTSYHANGFGIEDQVQLANVYSELTERGVLAILSNSYTETVLALYKRYDIHLAPATRMINSNASRRGKLLEVIVSNASVVGDTYDFDLIEQLRLLEHSQEYRVLIEPAAAD